MTAQGQILEQVAKALGLDLDLVARAQRQAAAIDALAQSVRQVMAAFDLSGNWQVEVGQVDDCIVIGISGQDLGEGFEFALPVAEQASGQGSGNSAQGQGSGNSGNSGNAGSGSKYATIFSIAEKYGIKVSNTEKRAIAWYLPEVIRRILKANPAADNDAELRQVALTWLRESKAAQSRGIINLMDLGFSSSI